MWTKVIILCLGILLAYWYFRDDKRREQIYLKGKRVIVTGSSVGIGEQIAYHYARLGANVVVTARTLAKLNKVVEKCQSLSPDPKQKQFAVSADMTNLKDTKRVVEQAVKHLGGLDILVLNHMAFNDPHPFQSVQEHLDEFHNVGDVNFRSYVHLTSHALPELLNNEGSIILVNSIAGVMPMPFLPFYSAAKHGLNGFFSSLRNQFVALGQNVSITSCFLGLVDTENAMKLRKRFKQNILSKLAVPASPEDTAIDIVAGGARRDTNIYSPTSAWIFHLVYNLWPTPIEYYLRTTTMPV